MSLQERFKAGLANSATAQQEADNATYHDSGKKNFLMTLRGGQKIYARENKNIKSDEKHIIESQGEALKEGQGIAGIFIPPYWRYSN